MLSRDLSAAPSAKRLVREVAAVSIVVLVAYALSRPDPVATLGRLYDDVVYLSVGKSIADGTGYRSVHLVGAPVHVKFPPLLPTIYAAAWHAFGTLRVVATVAVWLNIVVTAASAGVLWWVARRVLNVSPVTAALFVLVPLLTDRTMFYFTGATSEPWMLLGWSVALVLVHRLAVLDEAGRRPTVVAVALGVTLALTVLARTQAIGIAVAILLGVMLLRVGARVVLVATLATVVPLGTWRAWHGAMMVRGPLSALPDQVSYTAWLPTSDLSAVFAFATRMVRIT